MHVRCHTLYYTTGTHEGSKEDGQSRSCHGEHIISNAPINISPHSPLAWTGKGAHGDLGDLTAFDLENRPEGWGI